MNIYIKICLCLILITNKLYAQPQWWQDKHPHTVFYNGVPIDTLKTKLTSFQRLEIQQNERIEQLEKERFIFYGLGIPDLGVRFNGKGKIYGGRNQITEINIFPSIVIDGDHNVEVISQNVSANSAEDYIFRVIKNNNEEVIPWTSPRTFKMTTDGRFQYAVLCSIPYSPEQFFKIEIYNKHNFKYQDALILDWRKPIQPKMTAGIGYIPKGSDNSEFLFTSINLQTSKTDKMIADLNKKENNEYLSYIPKETFAIYPEDGIKFIRFSIENIDRPYNYSIELIREIKNKKDTLNLGEMERYFDLYKELWKFPGEYELTVRPYLQMYNGKIFKARALATETIKFKVLPEKILSKSLSVRSVLLILLFASSVIVIIFILYRKSHNRKLRLINENRLIAISKLQSIRSKLNPHFVFNALSNIQNLIGKREIEKADHYLIIFSRLTRQVLNETQANHSISLTNEIKFIENYLEMEKLRDDFKFQIIILPENMDLEVEIPEMLLQPYIENAIKHALPQQNGDGIVQIIIEQSTADIILKVIDNGKWDIDETYTGNGLALSENHINNLNAIYSDSKISVEIQKTSNGTTVVIKLENWV